MPEQSNEPMLPILDDEPKSGVYVDHDDLMLSEEEQEEGRRLGRSISVEDDDDNGLDKL